MSSVLEILPEDNILALAINAQVNGGSYFMHYWVTRIQLEDAVSADALWESAVIAHAEARGVKVMSVTDIVVTRRPEKEDE